MQFPSYYSQFGRLLRAKLPNFVPSLPRQLPTTTLDHWPVGRQVTLALPPKVQLAEQVASMAIPAQVDGKLPLLMVTLGTPEQVVGGAAGQKWRYTQDTSGHAVECMGLEKCRTQSQYLPGNQVHHV